MCRFLTTLVLCVVGMLLPAQETLSAEPDAAKSSASTEKNTSSTEEQTSSTEERASPTEDRAYAPSDDYLERDVEGWRVLVLKKLVDDDAELDRRTMTLLRYQLFQVTRIVPATAVEKLRKVTIWVEANEPNHPCMVYHPAPGWLVEHDMNPAKARCVEIANARNFLDWTLQQPWMVLHELAHAYHHQFLDGGFQNARLRAVFDDAVNAKRYDTVLRINGRNELAYAKTNPMEYFAEASEAFFGTNDFYPYVRSELEQHDPRLYELLQVLWGEPNRRVTPEPAAASE